MKAWILSDSHGFHKQLQVPKVDMVIHAGDSTNYYDLLDNQIEFHDFKDWFFDLPIQHKILIGGNHDAWATKKYNVDDLKSQGVIYLEHGYADIDNRVIFGSPYTPNFGNWYFMKDRGKIARYWEDLEKNIDVLITHGPPKGILDLTENRDYSLEQCGDNALYKKVIQVKPKFHIFGHIHDFKDCKNTGMLKRGDTTFINAALVEDGRFEKGILHNGYIIEI